MAEQNEQSEMDKAADFLEKYENGNKMVVPAGFKIINPDDDVTKGIVIEDATATELPRDESDSINQITCKAKVYPCTYITQEEASNLCQGMYSNSNFESDLINSYAWDTAIVFIQAFSGDTDYSRQVGRNTARAVQKCGESILYYNLDEGDEAQDKRCNIYDMAGNTMEWITETYSDTNRPCVYRGGHYYITISYTRDRNDSTTTASSESTSARPTLYL